MKRHRACGMYPFVVRTQWTAVVRSIQSETTTPGQPRRVRVSRGRTQASARPLNTPKPSFDIARREEGLRPEKVSVVIDVGRRGGRHALINASWSLFNDWRLIRLQSKLFNYLDPYSTGRVVINWSRMGMWILLTRFCRIVIGLSYSFWLLRVSQVMYIIKYLKLDRFLSCGLECEC